MSTIGIRLTYKYELVSVLLEVRTSLLIFFQSETYVVLIE